MQLAPFTKGVRRRVVEAAIRHGYAAYGDPDGRELLFRSPAARLRVAWDRGYLSAAVAPWGGGEDTAVDDDLFRQAVDGEAPHPEGISREWTDANAFVTFLASRLPEMERAALAPDPDTGARLAAARTTRAARLRGWLDGLKRPERGGAAGARDGGTPGLRAGAG